jgi:lysophospholipase L1-like esterase
VGLQFSPPSVVDGPPCRADADAVTRALWSHFRGHRSGRSVIKNGGTYTDASYVYSDDIDAADVFYQGGHIYDVSLDEAMALLAAGYDLAGFGSWAQSLADRNDAQATAIFIGDSITAGTVAESLDETWVYQAQELVRAEYPTTGATGGVGFIAASDSTGFRDDAPTLSGTAASSTSAGFGYNSVELNAPGDDATFPVRDCTSIRVWFGDISSTGAFSITVDGGDPVLVPCRGSISNTYRDHWIDVPFATSSSREVVLTYESAGTLFFPDPIVCGVQYFDGDEPPGAYLQFPGSASTSMTDNKATTPDHADLDLTDNELTFRVKFRPDDPAIASRSQFLIARADTFANKRSVIVGLSTTGHPRLLVSTNGTAWQMDAVSTGDALTAGQGYWVEWKLTRDVGTVDFRISTHADDLATDDAEAVTHWEAHGSQFVGDPIDVPFATDIPLRVGSELTGLAAAGHFVGRVYAVQVKNGATVVTDPIFARTSHEKLTDSTGKTWTADILAATPDGAVTVVTPPGGKGIHFINAARSGAHASTYALGVEGAAVRTDIGDWIDRTNASMVVVALSGINEFDNNVPPDTYRSNLQAVIDDFRAADPDLFFAFVMWWEPFQAVAPVYEYAEYCAVLREIQAATPNSGLIDFSPSSDWPQPSVAGFPGPLDPSGYYFDGFHPTAAGHTAIAAVMAAELDPVTSSLVAA